MDEEVLMKESRSKDNCYLWISQNKEQTSTCLISNEGETILWHKKLGHLNLKIMKRIISEDAIYIK
jgi:hypothetical protein